MAAAAVGLPVWTAGVWADTVWEEGTWEDSGSPTPSTDPFGDVRHSAFGDRVRRSSSWFVIFLSLWVG